MIKRKMPTQKLSSGEVMQGKQYPGIKGKVVHWADHAFEEGILYVRIRHSRQRAKPGDHCRSCSGKSHAEETFEWL
jgi:hypothetical protein